MSIVQSGLDVVTVSGVEFSVDRVNASRVWVRTAPACLLHFTDDSSPPAVRRALLVLQLTCLLYWLFSARLVIFRPPAMLAAGHSVLPLSFISFFFSLPILRGRLTDRHQTLPYVRRWPRLIKFGQKFGWPLPPPKFDGPKHQNFGAISHNFATWSWISPERNKTSSIEKRRCKLRTQLNSVYFGPQTAKNRTGVLTHLTGGHQAGHCHTSS